MSPQLQDSKTLPQGPTWNAEATCPGGCDTQMGKTVVSTQVSRTFFCPSAAPDGRPSRLTQREPGVLLKGPQVHQESDSPVGGMRRQQI